MLPANDGTPRTLTAAVLRPSELTAIHNCSLRVLDEVGVEFQHPMARDVFSGRAGVRLDGNRVHLAGETVEWAIDQAPASFTLKARDPANDLTLGNGNLYYTSAFGATFVCDLEQKAYRKAKLDDVAAYLRVADGLENVHYVLTPFVPQDVPPQVADIYAAAVQFNNTEKHVAVGVPTPEYLDVIWKMGQMVADDVGVDGPIYSLGSTVNSPLVYSREILPKMIHAAQREIPLRIVSGALAGATAPVTLAGALALQNAEILAGVTLCQLVKPGCPLVYGTFVGGMDMRTAKWAAAGPEMSLINSASAQLCGIYQIPLGYGTGGVADCRVPDVRAGFEKGLTNLAAAMCGVEVIHDGVSGLMAGGMAVSLEQLVIDNEIADWVNRFVRGISVDEDALAYDVIRQVGPGGNYLDHEHTLRWFRQEHLISPLLGRDFQLEWPEHGFEDLLLKARRKTKAILADHHPTALSETVKRDMQSLLVDIGGQQVVL